MADDLPLAVKSADRVFDLFELLGPRSNGLSHAAIAAALDIPKSSLTQLLKTAIARGYIHLDPGDKRYRLGDRFGAIVRRTTLTRDLVEHAAKVLAVVTTQTRESSALNMLKGDMAEVVATMNSPQRLVSHLRLGDLAPLYATSGGKILLAHLPAAEFDDYLSRIVFEATTPATLSSAGPLRREMAKVRREGVARSFEEYTPGIVGIATAILSDDGIALGSLNVAIPAVRYSETLDTSVVDVLRDASAKLEARARL